jgi:copper chaperone
VLVTSQTQKTILKIEGMRGSYCEKVVENVLQNVPGVVSASVDLEKKEARILGEAMKNELEKAVEDAGFTLV